MFPFYIDYLIKCILNCPLFFTFSLFSVLLCNSFLYSFPCRLHNILSENDSASISPFNFNHPINHTNKDDEANFEPPMELMMLVEQESMVI